MKIGLIGYGKMGKAIETIALERGHEIVFRINSKNPIESVQISQADVCIEFSTPDNVISHIQYTLDRHIPIVVGTTGWNNQLEKITQNVEATNGSLIYASNFSIGVNLFFRLNEQLAKWMSAYPEYAVSVEETHHTEKKDYPSGTAISITEGILAQNKNYQQWKAALNQSPDTDRTTIPICSYRKENVPGTHVVTYASAIDSIKIEHEANNRKGFALGAVIAAEWILHHQGIHTFKDLLNID